MSLQLKNAKQMQLAAEASKRHEEEILRAKAEKQQQQQSEDSDEHGKVRPSTPADVNKPAEPVEQSIEQQKDETSEPVSDVQLTGTDEDSAAKPAGDKVSSSADNSEQVMAEVNAEVVADDKVDEDAEPNQRLSKAESAEMENAAKVQGSEHLEEPKNLENAAVELSVVEEVVPCLLYTSPSPRD